MKFTVVLALVSAAAAGVIDARGNERRQVAANLPAMAGPDGQVVPFNTEGVRAAQAAAAAKARRDAEA